MKLLRKIIVLVYMLILAFPATAGDWYIPERLNSSETLAVVSIISVVSVPMYLSEVKRESEQKVQERERKKIYNEVRSKAPHVPDMVVKEVGQDENGHPHVRLEDPNNPEVIFAVLTWPNRTDNSAAGFRVGRRIRFQSSDQGSGWFLRDRKQTLAFVPVDALRYTGSSFFYPNLEINHDMDK